MRRWLGAFFAATSLIASGEPAPAAAFNFETANWFVFSLTNSCIAGNRPPAEYNFSPWNSLTLHAAKDGSLRVEVTFWPGLFKQGDAYKLTLHAEGRSRYVLDAEAVGDYSVKTTQPVGADFIEDLQGPKLLQVSSSSVPIPLGFDISHVAEVLKALDDCRKTLGG